MAAWRSPFAVECGLTERQPIAYVDGSCCLMQVQDCRVINWRISMDTVSDDSLIDEYVKMILELATVALNERDVSSSMQMIVSEACFYLSIERKNGPQSNLHTFEKRLLEKADVADKWLPAYKKNIED